MAFGEALCDSEAVLIERADPDAATAAARDQLAGRVQGVVFGQQYLMLDYDCPRTVLDRATAVTPGLESPTIAPLADPAWVAVRALVPRRDVNAHHGRDRRHRRQGNPGLRHQVLPLLTHSGVSFRAAMTQVLVIVFCSLLIGVVAGLRALTPPAVVAWGALLGWLPVDGTWAQWVGHPITVAVLTVLLVVELVTDQLPKTPSRTVPPQFVARLLTGAFAGAVIGSAASHHTFIAHRRRASSARCSARSAAIRPAAGWSRPTAGATCPIALTEDAIAVLGGFAVVALASTALRPYR